MMNIRVVKIITGFRDRPYIEGLSKEELSKYKEYVIKDTYDNTIYLGYQEGFLIQNIDKEPLDISSCRTNDNKTELKYLEMEVLQTKDLIFLLFKNNQSLEIDNGKFYINLLSLFENKNLTTDDYLSNFYFDFNEDWKKKLDISYYDFDRLRVPIYFLQLTGNKSLKTYTNFYWPIWGKVRNDMDEGDSLPFVKYIRLNKKRKRKIKKHINLIIPWKNNRNQKKDKIKVDLVNVKEDLLFNLNSYYRICNYFDTLIETHLKGYNPYTRSTKKDRMNADADKQIFYSWTTIRTPDEFNQPYAQGNIVFVAGVRYDYAKLKNFNFGNLNIYKYDAVKYGDDSYNPTIQKRVVKFAHTKFDMTLDESLETSVLDRCSGYIKNLNLVKREKNRPRIEINNDLTIDNLKINKDFNEISYEGSQNILKINNLTTDENKIKISQGNDKITLNIGELNYTGNKNEFKIDCSPWGRMDKKWMTFNLSINKINNPKVKKLIIMNVGMSNLEFIYNKKLQPIKVGENCIFSL